MRWGLVVGLVVVASACSVPAAPTESLPGGGELVSRFGEARALATDGAGRVYVVDAAASEVVVLDTSGGILDRLGGTDSQAFLDITDVDPTNGQSIFVADAGTGRIVRFTAEGRAAETVAVPRRLDVESPVRAGEEVGRPVAVAAGPGNTLYAIEAERGVVLRWDADRALDRVLGGPASSMPLESPAALAITENGALLVAESHRIVVFDAFGAVEGAYPMDDAGRVRNVTVADGIALAVTERGVVRLDGKGGVPVELGEALVDVAIASPYVYLLTRTRLIRIPLDHSAW
ncbi:MAG: NHL repeat-containing protein [Rubricoccaceae bacterium]